MENYYNYFTEIEECYQHARGTPVLLSTLDWALVESWQEAGIPLEAVCAGIQRSFEKFARRPHRFRKINSIGYCTQEVMVAAAQANQAAVESGAASGRRHDAAPPFEEKEILAFFERGAASLERAAARLQVNEGAGLALDFEEAASELKKLAAPGTATLRHDLQRLERSLTAIEDKLTASLTRGSPVDLLVRLREEAERGMTPFRRTMNATQIESLERQFLKKRLFEHYDLPRLSLFYLC